MYSVILNFAKNNRQKSASTGHIYVVKIKLSATQDNVFLVLDFGCLGIWLMPKEKREGKGGKDQPWSQ